LGSLKLSLQVFYITEVKVSGSVLHRYNFSWCVSLVIEAKEGIVFNICLLSRYDRKQMVLALVVKA